MELAHRSFVIQNAIVKCGDAAYWKFATEMKSPVPSSHSWLPDFPERTPLLGLHTTNRTTIQAELAAADSHGVDFFEMLFYDPLIVGSCAQGECQLINCTCHCLYIL